MNKPKTEVFQQALQMGFNQLVIAVEHPTAYIPYMPKLRHYDDLNTARFVTFSCYRRLQLLVQSQVIRVFLETVSAIRKEPQFRLLGYVIMPEHVHLVLHPIDGRVAHLSDGSQPISDCPVPRRLRRD